MDLGIITGDTGLKTLHDLPINLEKPKPDATDLSNDSKDPSKAHGRDPQGTSKTTPMLNDPKLQRLFWGCYKGVGGLWGT